jgi:hypothetical protein
MNMDRIGKEIERGTAMSRSDFNDEHFVVSYELLKLFQWLLVHEQEALKKLVVNALAQGLKYELADSHDVSDCNKTITDSATETHREHTEEEAEDLQEGMVDFFTLLEMILHETMTEDEATAILQRTMIPSIYHIDTNACDSTSVALSVEKATAAVQNNTGENPKDVLCKELLKRWKPTKKPYAH